MIKNTNIIVLMAGDATRFINSKYQSFKPLIPVKGKTILEWTLSSIPSLLENGNKIHFAIRYDHDIQYGITEFLEKTYGNTIEIIRFNALTRGNLETAFFSSFNIKDKSLPVLILDSDNYYNGDGFADFIDLIPTKEFAAICCFQPLDKNPKWCFAFIEDGHKVVSLSEKDVFALDFKGKPMVGVFYFSSLDLFHSAAQKILTSGDKVKNEFFMSQSISNLISRNIPVYGYEVDKVIPLGTPEDVDKYENSPSI